MFPCLRLAHLNDIANLVELNNAWFKPNLKNQVNGFLSVKYDDSYFASIIANNDLIVFTHADRLVGYALVNTIIRTAHIDDIQNEYNLIYPLSTFKNIAFSYQILIDSGYQGMGFFQKAEEEYIGYFKKKYDLIVSTVSKENHRSIAAHRKTGWSFLETQKNYYIITK